MELTSQRQVDALLQEFGKAPDKTAALSIYLRLVEMGADMVVANSRMANFLIATEDVDGATIFAANAGQARALKNVEEKLRDHDRNFAAGTEAIIRAVKPPSQ